MRLTWVDVSAAIFGDVVSWGACCDGRLVHGAVALGEEDVHDDRHGNAADVHAQRAADQQSPPEARIRVLNLFNAELCPVVRQINKQDQSNQQEQHRAHKGHVVSPDLEEAIRYQKADHNQRQPRDNLRSPEAILYRRSLIFTAVHSQQKHGQDGVEKSQGEVDAVHGGVAKALLAGAVDGHVVEEDALEFAHGPVGHGEP